MDAWGVEGAGRGVHYTIVTVWYTYYNCGNVKIVNMNVIEVLRSRYYHALQEF